LLSSDGRTNTTLKPLLPAIHLVAYTHCSSKVNVFKGFTLANVSNVSSLYAESCFVCIAGNRFTAGRNIGDNDYNDGTATLLWGNFIVKDNVFDSNQVGDQGGGVMLISQDSSLVEGNIFFANFAKHGGGIAVSGSKAVIRRNLFISNTAAGYGGAIFLCRSSKCMVYNNTIDSCASLNGSGGGAGLYLSSRDTLFNNIMAYCTGYSIWQWTLSGSWAAYNDCYEGTPENYHGITEGTGSISLDPQFVGGEPFDYDLKFTSPCINTGNPEPAYNDPDGSRNDMGAYPFSNHAPLSFALLTPANATSVGLATLRPLFSWDASVDPDTGDVVTYDLVIATDSNFSFVQQILNLATTSYTLTTDLQWGQQYFWNARASDGNGGEIWSPQMFTFRTMTLGDANNDAIVGIADVVFLIDYIFAGGAAPQPLMTGDPNCNGRTNIGDVVYLINYIFLGGPAPCDEWK
jgi:parallel beta-helix repeat protein